MSSFGSESGSGSINSSYGSGSCKKFRILADLDPDPQHCFGYGIQDTKPCLVIRRNVESVFKLKKVAPLKIVVPMYSKLRYVGAAYRSLFLPSFSCNCDSVDRRHRLWNCQKIGNRRGQGYDLQQKGKVTVPVTLLPYVPLPKSRKSVTLLCTGT
jgi:hypothetical protein